eukprot:CAMPEP_0178982380 /NCGR_PEP_ID=MMETSP0795-20121207/466_1 /TAXON_ID=88552 /ORGANISM="Amoebophrya sp., Strain Ameob2" /LENGTH=116 /DNA_ID=CAMNT_0020673023 /DNA_START=657 /DNA_END=1007 /DNA_ORIENTATION=+
MQLREKILQLREEGIQKKPKHPVRGDARVEAGRIWPQCLRHAIVQASVLAELLHFFLEFRVRALLEIHQFPAQLFVTLLPASAVPQRVVQAATVGFRVKVENLHPLVGVGIYLAHV